MHYILFIISIVSVYKLIDVDDNGIWEGRRKIKPINL